MCSRTLRKGWPGTIRYRCCAGNRPIHAGECERLGGSCAGGSTSGVVRGTTWNKDRLPLRLANLLTISCTILWQALLRLPTRRQSLSCHQPPFVAVCDCARLHTAEGGSCLLVIHDVYPEVVVAAGMLRPTSLLVRIMDTCTKCLYRSVASIIVIGRDMRNLVARKLGGDSSNTTIITNWSELDAIRPESKHVNRLLSELGLIDKFVVQYSGNMGRRTTSRVFSTVLNFSSPFPARIFWSWEQERKRPRSIRRSMPAVCPTSRCSASDRGKNCVICSMRATSRLIAFVPGMSGVSVPSRMYNILAAGKPIIAVTDADSELSQVVEEEGIGWVVPPQDPIALAAAIIEARSDPTTLTQMGRRARAAAETRYHLNRILSAYEAIIEATDVGNVAAEQPRKRVA